jgi:hypothetical protein
MSIETGGPVLSSGISSLTEMQAFYFTIINKSNVEMSPGYLSVIYYESKGKRSGCASRRAFGQTSASYRTCRKLVSMNLINENIRRSSCGYINVTYSSKKMPMQ